jgi:hypothetical protein
MITYCNFSAARFQPVHNVIERVLRTVCSNLHGGVIVGPKKVVVSIGLRHVAAILAQIEDYKRN